MSSNPPPPPPRPPLPPWAEQLVLLYESNAASQFILHGNVEDRLLLPGGEAGAGTLGSLGDFLRQVLLQHFGVVLSYDLGSGTRVEKGGDIFTTWPALRETPELPKQPRPAIETLTRYFRYCANLTRLGKPPLHVACILRSAHLVVPAEGNVGSYELNALALLIREWATEELLTRHTLATFLVTESLNDLHPLLVNNPRAPALKVPLPTPAELERALGVFAPRCPTALAAYGGSFAAPAHELAGASLAAVESLLKVKEHRREPLLHRDLADLKKQMVENEASGLIEFISSRRTLDDLYGQEKLKAWLRQDVELWRRNELKALPKGYLLCGPVGTGKTFLAECLAGEAGVPVVKIKNFRDKWVGTTEGNLEKIFRLLRALGRCFVFIDEADQTLGKRDAGTGDSGLSGRVYSMIAQEMSDSESRGRVIWILASSRPDLIEVDLKRPGRLDVKIPLFPAASPEEAFRLIQALCRRYGLEVADSALPLVAAALPELLTPAAAEALAFKTYRAVHTRDLAPEAALAQQLQTYRSPVPREVMELQIRLAVAEASDLELVPEAFRC
jgi:SpoVK/Ycf46/Vps4 family AAA+-type ATPase